MNTRLYVGNFPYNTTENELMELFSEVGRVKKIVLISDRETGQPKGFGFVDMASEDEARAAIEQIHDRTLGGRPLRVSEARERSRTGGGPPVDRRGPPRFQDEPQTQSYGGPPDRRGGGGKGKSRRRRDEWDGSDWR